MMIWSRLERTAENQMVHKLFKVFVYTGNTVFLHLGLVRLAEEEQDKNRLTQFQTMQQQNHKLKLLKDKIIIRL